jgi:hypothetical protein
MQNVENKVIRSLEDFLNSMTIHGQRKDLNGKTEFIN